MATRAKQESKHRQCCCACETRIKTWLRKWNENQNIVAVQMKRSKHCYASDTRIRNAILQSPDKDNLISQKTTQATKCRPHFNAYAPSGQAVNDTHSHLPRHPTSYQQHLLPCNPFAAPFNIGHPSDPSSSMSNGSEVALGRQPPHHRLQGPVALLQVRVLVPALPVPRLEHGSTLGVKLFAFAHH